MMTVSVSQGDAELYCERRRAKRHRFHLLINVFLIYSVLPEINLKSIKKRAQNRKIHAEVKKDKKFLK
ncbi:hypothetical protein HMP0721_1521 [Pseudoramibacter alactolyticus ATCC 23263]|uniref:Uncharacterized protein n=1 Tax=Pseudoramibacter alactolyticus ATCC 23263 TaxID=887929 RepID=E6MHN2_9FIRM|nr:hypothetical protein [Pseudoramibacter alactolyticus]EFV01406.1 hypothetical protein HMP0721_1521 [Pseudoramibacter alactolyticus ATCC 23263]